MDPICNEINNHMINRDYKKMFTYDDESVQIYFDNLCLQSDTTVLDILLRLFPSLSIVNAIIYAYTINNKSLFELLCVYITDEFKTKYPNFIESMLLHSYEQHNGDKKKYILRDLLNILIKHGTFNCDDLFVNSLHANIITLAEITIKNANSDSIVRGFEIAYHAGNYSVAKLTYDKICIYRLTVRDLGYCPCGRIIELVRFQEFYKWEDQFAKSVEARNYYALESLVKKMPPSHNLPFALLEPAIANCPDSLLFMIVKKFNISGMTYQHIKDYDRLPLIDYYENKVLNNDWLFIDKSDNW